MVPSQRCCHGNDQTYRHSGEAGHAAEVKDNDAHVSVVVDRVRITDEIEWYRACGGDHQADEGNEQS